MRVIGVVHLSAMPGDAKHEIGGFDEVYERAERDAQALIDGGVDALIVENFGSTPFAKGTPGSPVPPHQLAAIATVARTLRHRGVDVGVNCLRNDAISAVGIAAACELDFIRINVHTGASVTDQGVIEGRAYETLAYRKLLDSKIEIWADVLVKHAAPLGDLSIEDACRDTLERGMADAIIVSGSGTGEPVDAQLLERAWAAAGERRVIVGSGVTPENFKNLAPRADGLIIGSYFKRDGRVENPVDGDRVKAFVSEIRELVW